MLSDFRLPLYSNTYSGLFAALHADVVGLRGRELFYEGSHLKAVQAINRRLDEHYMQPVSRFQQAYRVVRDQYGYDPHESATMAIELITQRMNKSEQLRCTRALVTCGLIARPEVFPASFRMHMDYVDCARGELEANLPALVPDGLTERLVENSRNTQLFILGKEDHLLQRWQGPRVKHPRAAAAAWPCPKESAGIGQEARLRIMLGVLASSTAGHGYRAR